jgi:hypothetical protein
MDRLDSVHVGTPALRRLRRQSLGPQPGRSVVVDEGLGSYGSLSTRFDALRREDAPLLSAATRSAARSMARALASHWRWATYERDAAGWQVNPSIAAAFRAAAATPVQMSDDVILLTQPWVDLGLLGKDEYRRYVGTIAELATAEGLRLVIRPHPGESIRGFDGIPLLNNQAPAELQPEIRGARLVIGETTTALLNLAAIFGVQGARLTRPGTMVRLARAQHDLLETFLGAAIPVDALRPIMRQARHEPEGS